jgi:Protein of unknown function (DUF3396)
VENAKGPLDIIEADGRHSVREVFTIVFYIRKPHFDVGLKIEEAIWRFANLVSFEALRFFADSEGEWQDLLERDLSRWLEEEYGSFAGTVNAHVILRGNVQHPADFYLRYAGDMRAGEENFASYFQCWVPKAYWIEHRNELVQFATYLAANLPFGFGYASLAAAGDDRRRIQRLARRYLAIDISYPNAIKLDIGDMAGGSYWVTYLGQVLTESVHGVNELQKSLPKGIIIDGMESGKCRLQLGPEPIVGDVNRREDVSLYRALASYFDHCGVLHIPERVAYFKDDAGLADREAQEAWHRRFLEIRV